MDEELRYLSINESNALLRSVKNTRDHAIVTLFLTTGLLLNELHSLTIGSIDWSKKLLHVSGTRVREITLNNQIFEALARYCKERPVCAPKTEATPSKPKATTTKNKPAASAEKPASAATALFLTNKGEIQPLSARSIDHLLRKYGTLAGIQQTVNAHVLRNTFAVRLFKEQVSAKTAAEILGITDYSAIQRYASASSAHVNKSTEAKNSAAPLPTSKVPVRDTRNPATRFLSKLFPIKPPPDKLNQPPSCIDQTQLSALNGQISPNPEELIFGRKKLVDSIRVDLSRERSVLLVGQLNLEH